MDKISALLLTTLLTAAGAQALPLERGLYRNVSEQSACAGGRAPDLTSDQFLQLKSRVASWEKDFDVDPASVLMQKYLICGQYLHLLMTETIAVQADDAPDTRLRRRQRALEHIRELLALGQTPRGYDGEATPWRVALSVLAFNRPSSLRPEIPIPLRDEYYRLYLEELLPNLPPLNAAENSDWNMARNFLQEAVGARDDVALKTIATFRDRGMLQWTGGSSNPIAYDVLREALSPDVSDEVFRQLKEAAGPYRKGSEYMLYSVINARNMKGLERLLSTGADPTEKSVLRLAYNAQSPELYERVREASAKWGKPVAEYVDENERRAAIKSSYACHREAVPGQQVLGSGEFGCYFVLHHLRTGKILPQTRYQLILQRPGGPVDDEKAISVSGTTDAAGRSAYVRLPFEPTPESTMFVEAVGEGAYPRVFRLQFANRYVRDKDYRIYFCDKVVYTGRSDAQGFTVFYRSPEACESRVELFTDTETVFRRTP